MVDPSIMTELQMSVIEKYENKNKESKPLSWYESRVNHILDKEMLPVLKASKQFPSRSANGGKVVSHVRHQCADIVGSLRKECEKYFSEVQEFYGNQEAYRMIKLFDIKFEELDKIAYQWWDATKWDSWYHEDTKISIKLKDHMTALKINKEIDKVTEVKGILEGLSKEDIEVLVSSGLNIKEVL
ncbi:hypothetical protein VP424E501_P0228 [Vibrio phage 424E50-1]|nr:hypothetical protein VP424E501_P0228 [Vibrio phage 424E50-1]